MADNARNPKDAAGKGCDHYRNCIHSLANFFVRRWAMPKAALYIENMGEVFYQPGK